MSDPRRGFEWFPFYVTRFLASRRVRRMDARQVGIYLLLMCEQWEHGPIPDDDDELTFVGRCGVEEVRQVLSGCFRLSAAGWVNDRLEEIRDEQTAKSEQAKRAADAKRTQSGRSTDAQRTVSGRSTDALPIEVDVEVDGEVEVEKKETPTARVVEKCEHTINSVALDAHRVLGMGLWGDELSKAFRDTKRVITTTWVASGVSLQAVHEAVHGLRLMIEDGQPEWLADRKGKPVDGIHVLAKAQAILPGPDGTQLRSLFDAARDAYHSHDQQGSRRKANSGPVKLSVSVNPGFVA